MTGLKPAKVFHGKYFDISMTTVHHVLSVMALVLCGVVAATFFMDYLLYAMIGGLVLMMLFEFFSDRHGNNKWSAD